ncbi:c-type cytochrome [Winogradskyella tangerina]|uniref:c-type cytochrome n=1 Tax=Winogradskyella tangerina TaxID=2023240 RepID=UPI000DBE6C3D|nr:c-type cytochrome [Winogradskyella tangerina]
MKKMVILVIILTLNYSCKKSNQLTDFAQVQIEESENLHPGKQLMENLCYTCHAINVNNNNRLAPPMKAVKKHYISGTTTKEEFTENLKSWVANPNEDDAKMYGAVRRFGIMPKANFNETDIEQIADYMYNNVIEAPRGYGKHHKMN